MPYALDHPRYTSRTLITQSLDFLAKVCPDPARLDGACLRRQRGRWVMTVWTRQDDGSQRQRHFTMR